VSEEDAGRLDGASRWRLIAVVGALVLFAEAITFQQSMISTGAAAQSHQPLSVVTALVHFQGDLSYATAGFSVLALAMHITLWTAAFGLVGGPLGGYLARRVGGRLPLLLSGALLLMACALWVPWHKTWPEQIAIGVLWGGTPGKDHLLELPQAHHLHPGPHAGAPALVADEACPNSASSDAITRSASPAW
jgi:hypothetical protein